MDHITVPSEADAVTIGGITFQDPYAWLEADSERTLAWQAAQDAAAQERLQAWTGHAALREQLRPYFADGAVSAPWHAGERWFAIRHGDAGALLTVAAEACGEAEVLVDVRTLDDERGTASLDWFFPSPDGRLVAYGISFGGDEQSVLHLFDVDARRVLGERIPFMSAAVVEWLPDSSGFWCNAGLQADFDNAEKSLFFHRVGQGERSAPEPLTVREPYCVIPQVSADGRYVAALTSEMDVRPDFVKRLPDGEWEPFLEGLGHYAHGVFVGDDYVAVTMHGAPRGRLVRIPVATGGDPSTWTELIAEGESVMRSVTQAGDHLVLARFRDAHTELTVLNLDGGHVADVELPAPGVCAQLVGLTGHLHLATPTPYGRPIQPGAAEFTFVFSGPARSPGLYQYDIARCALTELAAPRELRDDLVVEERYAHAPDGTRVHHTLIRRADLDPGASHPTLLYGYGGFNIAFVSGSPGMLTPFIDAGGALVYCHLRGGGEDGEALWHGGRLDRKQNTFDDLYAIAENLIADGRTRPDQLGVMGMSNGGLLTGVAVTQRPDLFGAVVSMVPLYDMLKYIRDPYLAASAVEYGDPREPRDARWLHAYSPCHNVGEAEYPATLIYAGTNDMRCWPWHARKLAAQLQAANTGERSILLRAVQDGGHHTITASPEIVAEWLGFFMTELGLQS